MEEWQSFQLFKSEAAGDVQTVWSTEECVGIGKYVSSSWEKVSEDAKKAQRSMKIQYAFTKRRSYEAISSICSRHLFLIPSCHFSIWSVLCDDFPHVFPYVFETVDILFLIRDFSTNPVMISIQTLLMLSNLKWPRCWNIHLREFLKVWMLLHPEKVKAFFFLTHCDSS